MILPHNTDKLYTVVTVPGDCLVYIPMQQNEDAKAVQNKFNAWRTA